MPTVRSEKTSANILMDEERAVGRLTSKANMQYVQRHRLLPSA